MNFATLKGLTIPEGNVTQIVDASGRVLWKLETSKPAILQVEMIRSDTYAAETTYEKEEFILLDIYPKTNGTVTVTFGGLTKTITDTSGAEEPNAQQVYFGTFNGLYDGANAQRGELTIEGDFYAFGCGSYSESSKDIIAPYCGCITAIVSFGSIEKLPYAALGGVLDAHALTNDILEIPDTVTSIDAEALAECGVETIIIGKGVRFLGYQSMACGTAGIIDRPLLKTVKFLSTTPPEIGTHTNSMTGEIFQRPFIPVSSEGFSIEKIIVPIGCGNSYKSTAGLSEYADYIVEGA